MAGEDVDLAEEGTISSALHQLWCTLTSTDYLLLMDNMKSFAFTCILLSPTAIYQPSCKFEGSAFVWHLERLQCKELVDLHHHIPL